MSFEQEQEESSSYNCLSQCLDRWVHFTQPPSVHPKWDAFRSSFKQSNYFTDFWNWFMTLMSKAAERVLSGTVLYSGYQLLPGVPHMPVTIDAAVFVIQQGALDIGGMGLLKLAKRAGLPKDSLPVRLGVALVVLMILNVALASVKHTLPMLPESVFDGIETLLLIVRAIVAVLFGHTIHALREEYSDSPITVTEAHELQQRMDAYDEQLRHVQTEIQQRLREVQGSVSTLVQSVVQTQAHALMTELQVVQSQFKEVYALVQSLTPPHVEQAQEQGQDHETASEQGSGQAQKGAGRMFNSPITPVHSMINEPVSEPLEQRIKQYILNQRRQGSEPSLVEIMDKCACSKGSAIRYRRELNESSLTAERRVVGE